MRLIGSFVVGLRILSYSHTVSMLRAQSLVRLKIHAKKTVGLCDLPQCEFADNERLTIQLALPSIALSEAFFEHIP